MTEANAAGHSKNAQDSTSQITVMKFYHIYLTVIYFYLSNISYAKCTKNMCKLIYSVENILKLKLIQLKRDEIN